MTAVASQPLTDHNDDVLFEVLQQLLDGMGTTELQVKVIHAFMRLQIGFVIEQFAADLQTHMAFTPQFARLTASQIAPKTMFYSAIMLLRISGIDELLNPSIPPFFMSQGRTNKEALRYWLYVQVAPEMTAYLFDQNIDNYNQNANETNAVQTTIEAAASQLATDPNCYLIMLTEFLTAVH